MGISLKEEKIKTPYIAEDVYLKPLSIKIIS
jgi:hypothetical protein